ncbi:MAG: hypothetical protein NVSMB51_14210 [Solirubrobacteraceae bacterium]
MAGGARRPAAPRIAGTCADGGLTPDATNVERAAQATLCLVNAQRRRRGSPVLAVDGALTAAAVHHSRDMTSHGYFAHQSPNGETVLRRVAASGYPIGRSANYHLGENLAEGSGRLATPAAVVRAWMNSASHRRVLLDPHFRQTGLGVSASVPAGIGNSRSGATYTQDFGSGPNGRGH